MPKRPSAAPTPVRAASASRVQSDLVAAVKRLALTRTLAVVENAAVHKDMASLLAALADSLTTDADRIAEASLKAAAKAAGIPWPSATVSKVETGAGRGVVKMELDALARGAWVASGQHLLITGPTQTGKSYIASALARAALESGHRVLYRATTELLSEWHAVRDSTPGRPSFREQVRQADLLVLDNFGEGNVHQHDLGYLRDIITERFDEEAKSICVVSSGGANEWREWLSDRDEARAIAARVGNAFVKMQLLRGKR